MVDRVPVCRTCTYSTIIVQYSKLAVQRSRDPLLGNVTMLITVERRGINNVKG